MYYIFFRRFCHTNIVELYGISYKFDKEGTKYLQIFMELCDYSLDDIIFNDANRSWQPCCMFENLEECQEAFNFFITILLDICRGLLYIHNKGFVHRDLKLSNILVSLCDYHLTKSLILHSKCKCVNTPNREKPV